MESIESLLPYEKSPQEFTNHPELKSMEGFKEMLESPNIRTELAIFLRKNFRLPDYDIDDVIQETSLKALQALENGQFNRNKEFFLPWLKIIARNFTIDWLEKRGKERPGSEIETLAQNGQGQLDWEILKDLKKFLNLLKGQNEKYYQIICLYDLEGKTYSEISKELEAPIGTVMSRLSRARKMLKKIMQTEKNKELI